MADRRARILAARSLPIGIYDTLGRFHPNIVRKAIRSGQMDGELLFVTTSLKRRSHRDRG